MKDSRELANQILTDIAELNPYTAADKHRAFIWATGFLARVLAEIMWRDSSAYQVYRRICERAREAKTMAPLRKDQN